MVVVVLVVDLVHACVVVVRVVGVVVVADVD